MTCICLTSASPDKLPFDSLRRQRVLRVSYAIEKHLKEVARTDSGASWF